MKRAFQIFVAVLGSVMVLAGLAGVLLGVDTVPNPGGASATVDSEMRFFAVWYAVAGAVLLHSVPKIEQAGHLIRIIAGAFFLAGCARVLSWIVVGPPHGSQKILLAIELILPLIVLPWHAAVARRGSLP